MLWLLLFACKPDPTPTGPVGRYSAVGGLDADDSWLYVAGGGKGTGTDDILTDAWRYSTSDHGWEQLGDLPEPMLRGTGVQQDGVLWVFGGTTTGWVDSDRLYAWDLAADSWERVDVAGPPPRFKAAAAMVDGALWVQGGHSDDDGDVVYDDLWSFDTAARTWTELATTGGPGAIHRQAVAYDAGRRVLWCDAGFQDPEGEGVKRTDRLWKLDIDLLAWVEVTWTGDAPGIRASQMLVLSDGDLVLWGGTSDDERIWRFDPDASTWTAIDVSPRPLARDAMVVDITDDGATTWFFGGDPVSKDVEPFVADVWTLDMSSLSWVQLEAP